MDAPRKHQKPQASLNEHIFSSETLAAMSATELAEALDNVLDYATEETYDGELVTAILNEIEKKAPAPKTMEAGKAYECFHKQMRSFSEDATEDKYSESCGNQPRRVTSILRIGLVAVISILCAISLMIAAQAAGIDVFGEVARWSEKVFSFGELRGDSVKEQLTDEITKSPNSETTTSTNKSRAGVQYATLKDALDACGITEVVEPDLPNGYNMTQVSVVYQDNSTHLSIVAVAQSESDSLVLQIRSRCNDNQTQIEKDTTNVSTADIEGTIVYLIDNLNSCSLAWETNAFEYYLGTSHDKDTLLDLAERMIK